jgi:hypothetical protein
VWAIAAVIALVLGFVLVELVTTDDRPPPTPSFGPPS